MKAGVAGCEGRCDSGVEVSKYSVVVDLFLSDHDEDYSAKFVYKVNICVLKGRAMIKNQMSGNNSLDFSLADGSGAILTVLYQDNMFLALGWHS